MKVLVNGGRGALTVKVNGNCDFVSTKRCCTDSPSELEERKRRSICDGEDLARHFQLVEKGMWLMLDLVFSVVGFHSL